MSIPVPDDASLARLRVRVRGIVQGVGFRPTVHRLASELGLTGGVGNDASGAVIEIEGREPVVDEFLKRLGTEAPPLAVIQRMEVERADPRYDRSFEIWASHAGATKDALVSPDVATCADCVRELFDPADRRYRYPFVNCTNCGPRFTIVRDVPYDRPTTTMACFPMCADCAAEYDDPADRRFHAQPIACPVCGPRLRLLTADGEVPGDPIEEATRRIERGEILALKGIGGYHLACDATNEDAVARLRARKHREEKPFALMARSVEDVLTHCAVSEPERALLEGIRRPIVLLRRADGAGVAPSVAPGNRFLGFMLPYAPVHHLLLERLRRPIVLTSGNVSDEPIAYDDADAMQRLSAIADAFLTHDRDIHVRCDDSVVRADSGRATVLRRSRGYAPQPVLLPVELPRPVLAVGAELKNTFCLAKHSHAFVSHHIGDLENYETLRAFTEGIAHYARLFDVRPEIVAHDLHPEYLPTKWALEQDGLVKVGVQHHHAHIASCLADNGQTGPAIGVAFDGLGYGTDGTLWGGEFLIADLGRFDRVGHLEAVPLPGGAAAIREPWRMALVYLERAFGEPPASLPVVRRTLERWPAIRSLARTGVSALPTSSMGRLFDAVGSICGVRDAISYEGQAAIELEQLADETEERSYPVERLPGDDLVFSGSETVRAAVEDLLAGAAPPVVAGRFHNTIASLILSGCLALRERTGLSLVALSGGVFQNVLLLRRTLPLLEGAGFRVLTHLHVPPNDGGISLGQVVIAGSRGYEY